MREALAEAKLKLGEDVTVLHTKQYSDSAWFGLARRPAVEIVAAADTTAHRPPTGRPVHSERMALGGSQAALERPDSALQHLVGQISEIKRLLARLGPEKPASPIIDRLIRHGVPEKLAEALISSEENNPDRVIDLIARRIRCSGPLDCGIGQARVALVGPTGAGKTTTAAKLAARYALVERKKVALLTLDTYRIGAVEQLAAYARIMQVPLEVALCPEDVEPMISRHSDKDLIIIDTVGRSQRNREHIAELGRFLKPARPTEVHLVVSASASSQAREEALRSFGSLGTGRLILTKLDECPLAGCILELAAASLMPFSYITCGQEVPDDIELAQSQKLARLVWEGAL